MVLSEAQTPCPGKNARDEMYGGSWVPKNTFLFSCHLYIMVLFFIVILYLQIVCHWFGWWNSISECVLIWMVIFYVWMCHHLDGMQTQGSKFTNSRMRNGGGSYTCVTVRWQTLIECTVCVTYCHKLSSVLGLALLVPVRLAPLVLLRSCPKRFASGAFIRRGIFCSILEQTDA
jgi:hypothetical protein